ncbi:MAG TPA: DNA double-strand break repair nuclease NurA [Blastocatellia bacterium]|nr:DNA double-strand break repair nuclease NurA [Blastocatellia bacterium]
MIYRDKILAALESRRDDFAIFEDELRKQYAVYRAALLDGAALSVAGLSARLTASDSVGALPLEDFSGGSAVSPFGREWKNHDEARAWAFETLLGRTTFAADGSQILPTKDYSVPVAAVQVGWFENPHTPSGAYVKDTSFEILAPDEIMVRTGGATEVSEQVVHRRRYEREVSTIKSYLLGAGARGFDPDRPPVVFFDSLLVISFAEILPPAQREFYVKEIVTLLDTSEKAGIPVVGYIDTSFSRDLVNMLQAAFDLEDAPRLNDAMLVSPGMLWGDRTPLFVCARQGILDEYSDAWRRGIGFVYLKTSGDAPPSRLDLPLWVYERGLLDYVIDTVRGEVVIGNGYPYAIEAADAAAVITSRDRDMFYSLFQEFAGRESLDLHVARKAISKAHRR